MFRFEKKPQDQCCGSGMFILDPGSGFSVLQIRNRFFSRSRIPTPYFLELSDKILGKKFYNSLKTVFGISIIKLF
jgi:hypothetical protein